MEFGVGYGCHIDMQIKYGGLCGHCRKSFDWNRYFQQRNPENRYVKKKENINTKFNVRIFSAYQKSDIGMKFVTGFL